MTTVIASVALLLILQPIWILANCPSGFQEIMGKCYFYSQEETNQEQAQASCRALGGDLFQPRNEQEYQVVTTNTDNLNGEYWLGMQRAQGSNT